MSNVDSNKENSSEESSLSLLSTSMQKSIKDCFDTLTISPDKGRQLDGSNFILHIFDLWTYLMFFFHAVDLNSNSKISSNCAATNTSISPTVNSTKWIHPIPFEEESSEIKISMILKWVCGSESYGTILSGKNKLTNITTKLKSMKFNGYLRLFEVDMIPILDLMTESSQSLFDDFKNTHKEDAWKCPICSAFFGQSSSKWKCCRCLFWYHERCTNERKVTRVAKSGFSLCESCFFSL